MAVRNLLAALQTLPRDAELLAFEAGCEECCEGEVDEVQWQGGRVLPAPGCPPGRPAARVSGELMPSSGIGRWPSQALIR